MPDIHSIGTRWLGVGLAAAIAVVTLGLAVTGRLGLYVNPDSTWFAVGMSIVVLVGAVASFTLPLGAEADHGHDHGEVQHPAHAHDTHPASGASGALGTSGASAAAPLNGEHVHFAQEPGTQNPRNLDMGGGMPRVGRVVTASGVASAVGALAASGVVLLTLVLPPASLSTELAMSRDVGAAPALFGGADAVALATTGDTSSFGIGEWSTVFATATNPDAFDGDPVTLTGFVTPGGGDFQLTRLVITHCVIDAQPASLPIVSVSGDEPATGQWVTVTGTVRSSSAGQLVVDAASIEPIDEPADPYEF